MEFLRQQGAMLSVAGVNIHLGSTEFPETSFSTIHIPARTKALIEIPLKENNLSDGYIRKINAGPNVFLGETMVTRNGSTAMCFAINSTASDVQLTLAPVELEECTVVPPSPRTGAYSPNSKEGQKDRSLRFANLLKVLNLQNLTEVEKLKMYEVLGDHLYQFHLPGDKLGSTNLTTHKIVTTDEVPVVTKNYRHPNALRAEIENQVNDLLKSGIVQESTSPYNSPLWIVPKKPDAQGNKRWRMVVDYRALNKKTVSDSYPLPNITDVLDQLGGATYFSVLDLASGFHQIPMDPNSREKTAFSARFKKLEFNRMPFGLRNSPPTFQRLMDRLLSGLQGTELFVYMDDIVIYGTSLEDHDRKLRALLGRLKEAGLTLQPDKCFFLRKEITYLGHLITKDGVKMDPQKIQAVKNFPIPRNRKNIKQFLGLVGYYRRFIKDFAKIAKPLNNILKKQVSFKWNGDQQTAFDTLCDKICTEPILQYPNFRRPFSITTDASDYALGAVLSQEYQGQDLPVPYASCTLNPAECKYTTSEKELLAIVFAVGHFRPYIYGHKFTLYTDHRPLVWLHGLKDPVSRLARWKIKLSEYDYEIAYKPGKLNSNADALSRNPCNIQVVQTKNGQTNGMDLSHPSPLTNVGHSNYTSVEGGGRRGELCNKFDNDLVNINNIIERVFLSRSVTQSTVEQESAVEETDSEEYETAPEDEEESFSQVQQSEKTNFQLLLEDGRAPVSAQCNVTKNVTQAVGMRYLSSGERNSNTENEAHARESMLLGQETPGTIRAREPNPAPSSSGERSEGTGETERASYAKLQVEGCERTDSEDNGNSCTGIGGRRSSSTIVQKSSVLVLVDGCLKYSKDKLLMGKGHIVNFISADCDLQSDVNKELISQNLISTNDLKNQNPEQGQVIVFGNNGRYIFNVVVKNEARDKIILNNISQAIKALTEAMIPLNVQCVKFSTKGNVFDKDISWSSVEQIIKNHFTGNGLRAYVCSGEIIFPEKEDCLRIVKEFHESTVGGHKGVSKTYWRIRANYYWTNLKSDVQKFIRHCKTCQENKLVRIKNKHPMQITDTPAAPFEKIQIDIVGKLPETSRGNKYILTIQDNFSKYCDAIPIQKIDAETVATTLAEQFISRYGCPKTIHSDQGTNFTSALMKTFCKIFNIEKITSTAFHPQSLGSLERSHHTLVEYLKNFGNNQNWDEWLRFAVFSYNTSVHESTGYAPHTLVFGREAQIPSSLSKNDVPTTYVQFLKDLLTKLHNVQSEAYENLKAVKEKSKKYYDLKANPLYFHVGDQVYLLKEPQKSKFDSQYVGPYVIEKLLGDRNVQIRISQNRVKIVHVDKLKLAALPFNA